MLDHDDNLATMQPAAASSSHLMHVPDDGKQVPSPGTPALVSISLVMPD